MDLSTRFRINKPSVIQETFDDEVVVINLDNGNYYSLDNVGVTIWGFIEREAVIGELIEAVASRYEGERLVLESAVLAFLSELEREDILTSMTEPQSEVKPAISAAESEASGERIKLRFEAPVLHKFTDMQELLLLDPIHEVDERGWPNPSQHER